MNQFKKKTLPKKGPIGEGVDPLTKGKTYHGEDVQAASRKHREELNTGGPRKSDSQRRLDRAAKSAEEDKPKGVLGKARGLFSRNKGGSDSQESKPETGAAPESPENVNEDPETAEGAEDSQDSSEGTDAAEDSTTDQQ